MIALVPLFAGLLAWRGEKTRACRQNLKVVEQAMMRYNDDHPKNYCSDLGQLVPKYLPVIPHCPIGKRDTYSDFYRLNGYPSCSSRARGEEHYPWSWDVHL